MTDGRVALTLADAFLMEQPDRAVRVLSDYIDRTEPPNYAAIVRLLGIFRRMNLPKPAFAIIDRFKASAEARGFNAAWARLVVDQNDSALAQQILSDPSFKSGAVRAADPSILYRLLKLSGNEASSSFLSEALYSALSSREFSQIEALAELFQEEGRIEEFKINATSVMSSGMLEDVLERVETRARRHRFFR